MTENGIKNGNGATVIGVWKKNWKAIIGFCTLISMFVGFIIAVEARYAKAEDLKELTKQVSTVNENLEAMNDTQTEILQQMQTQQQQTIYAINSLSNKLQQQALAAKIEDLEQQKKCLEAKMEADRSNTAIQIMYQEICNDLRSTQEHLSQLNQPLVITTTPPSN